MTLDINTPLIEPTTENTHPANIEFLYDKYGKETVDNAVEYLTYKKTPPPLPKNEIKGKALLYVFRHGQSNDNINMIFSGWRAPKLTEKGEQDAEVIAEKIKDVNFDLLIASDQPRTFETMKLAVSKNEQAKNKDIRVDKRLRERNYGDWQGQSKLVKHLENPDALFNVRRGWDNPPPNGESMAMVNKRVSELLEELIPEELEMFHLIECIEKY
ncbi:histidine phosphatase family protein, partial [Patescibacteria group bacterium]